MPAEAATAAEVARYSATLDRLSHDARGWAQRSPTLESLYAVGTDALLALHIANRFLICHPWSGDFRAAAHEAMESLILEVQVAQWELGRLGGTHVDFAPPKSSTPEELEATRDRFVAIINHAVQFARACSGDGKLPSSDNSPAPERRSEIEFVDGVPLIPTVCPIVVLTGTNRDMGRQYAEQVIDIYGAWVFDQLAAADVDPETSIVLEHWTAELEARAPDVLEFARGWADGAQRCGVPLTEAQAIAVWTGYRAPSTAHTYMGNDYQADGTVGATAYSGTAPLTAFSESVDLCSGTCGWGEATTDGSLIAGSTTDHDCTFQATIIAFPETGNRFMYTPFSVNGSIPVLGRFFMAGHPGFNDKGVTYVHHGGQGLDGASCGGGPLDEWGYGVRRGAATFHMLQFANSASEARDMVLGFPVGDPGPILGTAGGLIADSDYGCVLEERAGSPASPKPILREKTLGNDGQELNILYANNNALSPDHGSWLAPDQGRYRFEPDAGWFITRPEDAGTDDEAVREARMFTKNSAARNRYAYAQMTRGYGNIDIEYMFETYRRPGTMPDGEYEDLITRYHDGEQWSASTGHRGNAFTAVVRVPKDEPGEYYGCVGPASRSAQVNEPGHGHYYYDETNAFWHLRLLETPDAIAEDAATIARERIQHAEQLAAQLPTDHPTAQRSKQLLAAAHASLSDGRELANSGASNPEGADLNAARVARAIRDYTRAQVRAQQVIDMIDED